MLNGKFTNCFLKLHCFKICKSSICHEVKVKTLLAHPLIAVEIKVILAVALNIKHNGKSLLF